METRRVILVLADISGYTRFVRLHRLSQAHAESIICELLDALIAQTEPVRSGQPFLRSVEEAIR